MTFYEEQTKLSYLFNIFCIVIHYRPTNDQLLNNVTINWLALLPKMSLN